MTLWTEGSLAREDNLPDAFPRLILLSIPYHQPLPERNPREEDNTIRPGMVTASSGGRPAFQGRDLILMSSAATLTAISSGVLLPMGRPRGQCTVCRKAEETPLSRRSE